MTNILRIESSARTSGSTTRDLNDQIVHRFAKSGPVRVINRDLTQPIPQINENWVMANFTPADDRSADQRETLALSDTLIGELQEADVIVIGVPIYNFGVPAALKAWVDQVARAGVTFQYSANGPVGLLEGKRAILSVASGGTEVGSDIDFATGYMRHVLSFIGITDVEVVRADRQMVDAEATKAKSRADLDALGLAA
ncbi:MAG: NAD(P)H-dependent oxidoreductase [Pseudomonadota bacterium]